MEKTLVKQAQSGSRRALEELLRGVQPRVYEMALRMLAHPSDAEDAAQEILIKIITHIGGFRYECAFSSWVYRIAANHLLTTRKRQTERMGLSFEVFERHIERSGAAPRVPDPEQRLLIEELRSNCMQAILVCLTREQRLAFILGEIFGVTGDEGATILNVTPATFRKRLSRGRGRVRRYMKKNCGLVHPDNPCQCTRQIRNDVANGWIDPDHPVYVRTTDPAPEPGDLAAKLAGADDLRRIALLFQTYPRYGRPDDFVASARNLLAASGNAPAVNI